MRKFETLFFFVETRGGETIPIEASIDPNRVLAFYQINDDKHPANSAVIARGESKSIQALDDFQDVIDRIFDERGANDWILAGMIHEARPTETAPVMIRKESINWVGTDPTNREQSIVSIEGFELLLADSVGSIQTQLRG